MARTKSSNKYGYRGLNSDETLQEKVMLEYYPLNVSLRWEGKYVPKERERDKNNSVPRDKWTKAGLKQKTVFPCGLLGSYSAPRGLRSRVYLN